MAIALKAFAVPVGVLGSCCAAGIAIPLSVSSSASKGDLVGGGPVDGDKRVNSNFPRCVQ
ncbi:hypothetical protein [Candidatus Mycoplasma haematominutum]|uniref:Lipoprotein n=1 Tax=Candidatus Mycoplasma haematominutum 'Birmingham 1' TaxID=1116213 RepID=G8C3R9_9MOLU|nr:hypothetical protein [Candidatus Mycoplasma haematominutum]CCE66967.1 hypothetical protein MHM_04490 [Candidatus Mycoplasma haematominutum 'Birmingham 1']